MGFRYPGFYPLIGVPTPFDPANGLVTSPVLTSPLLLAGFRLFVGLFTLSTLIVTLVWGVRDDGGAAYLSYFTHLSYIGICAYFFNAGVQGVVFGLRARSRRRLRSQDSENEKEGGGGGEYDPVKYPLQDWPRPLQALHRVLLTTVTTFPIVVTIVYWGLLSDPDTLATLDSRYSNISMHVLNTPFALFEVLLTNTPAIPWAHLPLTIIILGAYLGLAYVSHITVGGGYYPYAFLNPTRPGKSHPGALLAGYIIGIFIGFCVVFVIIRYLAVWRMWIVGKIKEGAAAAAAKENRENGTDEEHLRNPKTREQLDEWEVV